MNGPKDIVLEGGPGPGWAHAFPNTRTFCHLRSWVNEARLYKGGRVCGRKINGTILFRGLRGSDDAWPSAYGCIVRQIPMDGDEMNHVSAESCAAAHLSSQTV